MILPMLTQALCAQPTEKSDTFPRSYVCQRATHPLNIDGKAEEDDWQKAAWSDLFIDIEGTGKPVPYYETRVKMLWDDHYLYIMAMLKEEDLWATYTTHDAVIYHENDFEVFIDPDGDNHNYYELEINALGTVWDLMLTKPYRDQGIALDSWEIAGLKKGIHLDGTINNPGDKDNGWTIELALPWSVLKEAASDQRPESKDVWRINFSRVQWRIENQDGVYVKKVNPENGKPYPEYNWVWSPQYVIAMHQPETWGYLHFSDAPAGTNNEVFTPDENYETKLFLMTLYSAEHEYKNQKGAFTSQLSELNVTVPKTMDIQKIKIYTTPSLFEISYKTINGETWHVNNEGKLWTTKREL
ncbi:carbohydrate-binding family 9-like protein [Fulvivirga sp. M361]|nr:carbohydrate-binding family 9-like protein [Fulvivirga sp. M361]